MGLFDRFRRDNGSSAAFGVSSAAYGAGGYWSTDTWLLSSEEYDRIMGLSPSQMWRTQPYLRTVVTFLARNIAQLGLHAFQRADEDDRQRVRDGIGEVVARPNPKATTYELIYGLVADLALHDRAYWLLSPGPEAPITRLPVPWVTPMGGDLTGPDSYRVRADDRGEHVTIAASEVLAFHGWDPSSLRTGSSPVAALKEILAEQVQAARYREMVWRRGGKVGAVLSRPPDAPEWSDQARKQFKKDWESQFTGDGPQVGGTPLLEDGMTLSRVDFSAHDMQFIEGARLALNTVASVYHVNPTMIGLLDNANYSNVREFRRMLYGDTLGPLLAQIEDRLNTFLVPRFDTRPGVYLEFNIEEKLQGNFEEQTAALQSSVGRPWMTANEARALRNMPAIEGGEELVTPLNVLIGEQASPRDSAPPPAPGEAARELHTKAGRLFLLKARITDRQAEQVSAVLRRFFKRQRDADRYPHGGEWDGERWDRELAKDLHAVSLAVTEVLGKAEAAALGFTEDEYDTDATVNFLEVVAKRRAENINRTTKGKLDKALEDEDGDPAQVYEEAVTTRADGIATGLATFMSGFATAEAAGQIARRHDLEPTKTWVTSSGPNTRSEHAALNGETVPLSEQFSNGLLWPGDSSGDAADNANCNCTLVINLD
jgi:HK97 family phage portal protein